MFRNTLFFIILFLAPLFCFATTWDEPWQEEIIAKSEFLVQGKIIEASDSLVKVTITKSFGKELSGTITIDDFFMLDLCSVSGGHGPEFHFISGQEGYLFLKKGKNGNYQIPTPTSGFDRIVKNKVHATFRHTYHQAGISIEVYEMAYKAIWNKFNGLQYDVKEIQKFIDKYVSMEPAGFSAEEIDLFFNQHTALETAYLLGIEIDFKILVKHAESENYHSQVSAIRAMKNNKSKKTTKYLFAVLDREDRSNFTKVIAIWSLWELNNKKTRNKLFALKEDLSEKEEGFEGNIMDPRVCTHFPSPKRAVKELERKK